MERKGEELRKYSITISQRLAYRGFPMLMLDSHPLPVVGGLEHEHCGMVFCDREACWALLQEGLFHNVEHCVPMAVSCNPNKAFSL